MVDGPPLTEDQIKAYKAWKTQSQGKAPVVANPVAEEKKVMMEEYAQITKQLQRLQTQVKQASTSFDIDELCAFGNLNLPPKFKMPEVTKFYGFGDPKLYLQHYKAMMSTILGLTDDQIWGLFSFSLQGSALTWYLRLDNTVKENWKEVMNQYLKQYSYNTQIEVFLLDLQCLT